MRPLRLHTLPNSWGLSRPRIGRRFFWSSFFSFSTPAKARTAHCKFLRCCAAAIAVVCANLAGIQLRHIPHSPQERRPKFLILLFQKQTVSTSFWWVIFSYEDLSTALSPFLPLPGVFLVGTRLASGFSFTRRSLSAASTEANFPEKSIGFSLVLPDIPAHILFTVH